MGRMDGEVTPIDYADPADIHKAMASMHRECERLKAENAKLKANRMDEETEFLHRECERLRNDYANLRLENETLIREIQRLGEANNRLQDERDRFEQANNQLQNAQHRIERINASIIQDNHKLVEKIAKLEDVSSHQASESVEVRGYRSVTVHADGTVEVDRGSDDDGQPVPSRRAL